MKRACKELNTTELASSAQLNTDEQNASSIRPLRINFVRMKKKIYTLLFLVSLCYLANGQVSVAGNGDFESSAAGDVSAASWFFGSASGSAIFKITDSIKHGGANCLFLNVTQKAVTNPWDIQVVNEHIPTEAGSYYRASFWAKSMSGFSITASIGTYDYKDLTIATIKLTKSWQKVNLACYNADKTELRVPINRFEQGTYFFDDLQFFSTPIVSSSVVPTGDSIIVQALANLQPMDTSSISSFTIRVNGVLNPVKAIALSKTATRFILFPSTKIIRTDKISLSHTGGKLLYASQGALPDKNIIAFEDSVDNYSTLKTLDIKSAVSDKYLFFPNPATDHIRFNNVSDLGKVEIASINGQILKSINDLRSGIIDISKLEKGLYFVTFYGKDGTTSSNKLIKK
jgi:hypothetical protein